MKQQAKVNFARRISTCIFEGIATRIFAITFNLTCLALPKE